MTDVLESAVHPQTAAVLRDQVFKTKWMEQLVTDRKAVLEPPMKVPNIYSMSIDPTEHRQLIATSNFGSSSLSLNSTTTFLVTNIKSNTAYYINGSITLPAYCSVPSGWFYQCLLNRLYVTYPGASQLSWSGQFLYLLLMRSMSQLQRTYFHQYINPAQVNGSSSSTINFSIPLIIPGLCERFTAETSTFWLNNSSISAGISIQLQFNPIYQVMNVTTGQSATLPTSFNTLQLKALMTLDESPLIAHPDGRIGESDIVFLDSTQYDQFNYVVSSSSAINSLSIQQLPSGLLYDVFVSFTQPNAGNVGNTGFVNPLLYQPTYMRLNYAGQDLITLNSADEITMLNFYSANRDDGGLTVPQNNVISLGNT